MLRKSFVTIALVFVFVTAVELSALPVWFIKTPSNDVDKYHDDDEPGSWSTNWFYDTDGDGSWDMDEPWVGSEGEAEEKVAGGEWEDFSSQTDMSCWLASAANMLAAQGYNEGNAQGIYDELLGHYGWAEGGWQHEALDWYISEKEGMNPSYEVTYYGVYTGDRPTHDHITTAEDWPDDPYEFIKNELYRCQQVGIVLHGGGLYHAVTFYGWDDSVPFAVITDSDRDKDHYSSSDRNYYKTISSAAGWEIEYLASQQISIDYFTTLCPIPEPTTLILMLGGLIILVGIRKK